MGHGLLFIIYLFFETDNNTSLARAESLSEATMTGPAWQAFAKSMQYIISKDKSVYISTVILIRVCQKNKKNKTHFFYPVIGADRCTKWELKVEYIGDF